MQAIKIFTKINLLHLQVKEHVQLPGLHCQSPQEPSAQLPHQIFHHCLTSEICILEVH